MRHHAGPDLATCQRQTVDRRSKIEAMVLLVKPALGQKPLNETVDRALRRSQSAGEFGKCHAGFVDDLLEDLRDPIDGPVILRFARGTSLLRTTACRTDRFRRRLFRSQHRDPSTPSTFEQACRAFRDFSRASFGVHQCCLENLLQFRHVLHGARVRSPNRRRRRPPHPRPAASAPALLP